MGFAVSVVSDSLALAWSSKESVGVYMSSASAKRYVLSAGRILDFPHLREKARMLYSEKRG
jgi:hypothetical protein